MTDTRAWKIKGIADDIPPVAIHGDEDAEVLVLGWGSTLGVIRAAARRVRLAGGKVATAHLRHLNPFPSNLEEVLARYPRVLIPELNTGQLRFLIRANFLVPAEGINHVSGEPFKVTDIEQRILEMI
jgi:2-oxoglutarate ferredoxin oxidoreductase subunit alpha